MISTKIKTFLLATMGLFVLTNTMGQVWEIGYQNMTFVDASRGNRVIETKLFYPADVSGVGVPLGSPIDKKYPVVVFGHDENISWNHYAYLWNRLTKKGFIVAVPKTEMGPTIDVIEFAKDLAFVASQFNTMRYTPGSFFYQRHNSKSCVMGHGVGGSAATFAVQYYPSVTTMVSLAAVETVPSAINAATMVTVPSVVIGGGQDCDAPIATNQMPMFDNIDSDCKTFINFLEATHCHFAQNTIVCTGSELVCNPSAISHQVTNFNTTYLLVSFMRYYMKSNAPALAKFEWKLQSKKKDWTYIMNCNQNAPRIGFDDEESGEQADIGVVLYPNPVQKGNSLNLVINESDEAIGATVIITNMMGQVVTREEFNFDESGNEINLATGQLKSGYYMVSVISDEGRVSKPLVVQ